MMNRILCYRTLIVFLCFLFAQTFSMANIESDETASRTISIEQTSTKELSKKEKRLFKKLEKQSKKPNKTKKRGGLLRVLLGVALILLGFFFTLAFALGGSSSGILFSVLVLLVGAYFVLAGLIRMFR